MPEPFFSNNKRSIALIKWATILLVPMTLALVLEPFNTALFHWLNSRLVEWLGSTFWALLTNLGDGFFLFPLGMILVRHNPEKQQTLIITMILAALALNISKHYIDAIRPLGIFGESQVIVVGPEVESLSMPSGHSGTVFILAGLAILFTNIQTALLVLTLSILAGLSRVAVGAHFPADICAGAWIGLLCTAMAAIISERYEPHFLLRIFFILLGFASVFVLPFYENGFEDIAAVQYMQYLLAALALVLSLSELMTLVRDYSSQRKQKA